MHRSGSPCHALLCVLALAGCAHLPEAEEVRGGAPTRAAVAAAKAPAAPDPVAHAVPVPAPTRRNPAEYPDLFERMRSGFSLPSVENDSVRRQIDWYLEHPAYVERSFGRGRRYLYHIVETLEARDLPRELALVPVIESGFDPFALSRARASGLWQFIASTGRRYGLDQDWWADDRRDVLEATRAALEHLAELHEEFAGDWLLALAAYNCGAPNVKRAIERNQRSGLPIDFFALDLPAETRGYVPKLLAISRVVAEPQAFGIALPPIPNAPYFASVPLEDQVDLGRVADLARIPRDELRALNPAFNRWATAPDGPRRLLVPAPDRERLAQVLAALPSRERLRIVQRRVRRGDTLASIARSHRVTVADLRAANRLRGSLIHPGQILLIPLPARAQGDSTTETAG